MSKQLRRILSLVFALALLMSLARPACADGAISAADSEDVFEKECPEGSITAADDALFAEERETLEIYVSASGDDMNWGSREEPLATLAAAADLANAAAGDTVYVILLSDLTVTRTARFRGVNVILMSDEGTALVSRGSGFETACDDLRGAYNPAMIELGALQGASGESASLSLDNVILDDAGLHEGSEFLAQSTDPAEKVNNLERVQDAVIAVYGGSRLTIDPGSELRNFGGMSAVHAVGGSVTVEDYSLIHDTAAVASPAGLKAICAEGSELRIGTEATVVERGAAPAEPAEEDLEAPEEAAPTETADEAAGTPEGSAEDEAAAEDETPAEEAPEDKAPEVPPERENTPAGESSEESDVNAAENAEDAEGGSDGGNGAENAEAEAALAGAGDPAEPQGGEDEGGDDDGGSTLIDGLVDIISDQLPELDRGFIEALLSGLSGDYLKDLLEQLNAGGSVPDLIGELIGGGIDINIPGINTGSSSTLSFTAPAELVEKEDAPYRLPYKASFKLPDSLVTIIKFTGVDRVESGRVRLVFKLDMRLDPVSGEDGGICSVTGNLFEISEESYSAADHSVSVALTLKDGWKEHEDELGEALDLKFTGSLPEAKFAVGETLVSTAKLDNFAFKVGTRIYDGSGGDAELKAETKMLPADGAFLSYDINGGEGGPDPNPVFVHEQSGYALESKNVPTHPDLNGKPVVFLGWTAEKDSRIYDRNGTAPETTDEIDIAAGEDVTVYAVYGYDENEDGIPDVQQQLVELSFDANGGSGAPDPILAVAVAGVGASIDIPETEPTLKYYTFQGWSKDQNATEGEYKHDAPKAAKRDILITKDTVLYAVWKENPTYTLYYNANGGSGAPAAQSGVSDENDSVELTIASGTPTRSGYSFLGWSASRGGSASYFAGNKVKITGGNVTLYAVWQKGGGSYGGGGSSTTAPKTGDEAPIALYAALAVISLGAVGAGAWLILRKNKKK